jgi:acyl dehydratase
MRLLRQSVAGRAPPRRSNFDEFHYVRHYLRTLSLTSAVTATSLRFGVLPTEPDLTAVPLLAKGLSWEEQPVGFAFRTAARTITEADLSAFVGLTGFVGPLFLDARRAAVAGYTGRLVPGLLTLSFAEGLVMQTNVLHDTGLAFLGLDMEVSGPVYVGDTIDVVVEVVESRATSKPGRGLVRTRNIVRNQTGTSVLVYTPARLQRGRDRVEA